MLLSAAAAMPAHAQPPTGDDVERLCPVGDDEVCSGYVLGFTAGLMVPDTLRRSICMPKGVTEDQMLDVVRAYSKANPKDRQMPFRALVGNAYRNAWPCKRAR
jgi:hypothetical protein